MDQHTHLQLHQKHYASNWLTQRHTASSYKQGIAQMHSNAHTSQTRQNVYGVTCPYFIYNGGSSDILITEQTQQQDHLPCRSNTPVTLGISTRHQFYPTTDTSHGKYLHTPSHATTILTTGK